MVAFRCACGADVRLPAGGQGTCDSCGRAALLSGFDATQSFALCADIASTPPVNLDSGPDRSGERIGHFRLLSQLGVGGMGAVYRALDESLQRYVAVKVMRASPGGSGSDAKQVTRLLDEAISQARLNHPNVVTVYYVGREGEEPFFAMELLPGPTIAEQIASRPLEFGEVIDYAIQVVAALRQASSLGLVHGDIKPSNLILSDKKTVKLGDFGLARTDQTKPSEGISGTIRYMAPELVAGDPPSDQSDQFSLGVTLFEMTFGRMPHLVAGTTARELLQNQGAAEVQFPERWPDSVPEQWRGVMQRLLARDPADRYADYDSLQSELRRFVVVGVTNAGLLNRALAFAVDMTFWGFWLSLFMIPLAIGAAQSFPAAELPDGSLTMDDFARAGLSYVSLLSVFAPVVPLLACWLESRGGTTLGRYLFQIRVVDRHGLPISSRKAMLRSVMRYVCLWGASLFLVAMALGWSLFAFPFSVLDEVFLLANALPVLGPRRLALHDRLLKTHAVLDTTGLQR